MCCVRVAAWKRRRPGLGERCPWIGLIPGVTHALVDSDSPKGLARFARTTATLFSRHTYVYIYIYYIYSLRDGRLFRNGASYEHREREREIQRAATQHDGLLSGREDDNFALDKQNVHSRPRELARSLSRGFALFSHTSAQTHKRTGAGLRLREPALFTRRRRRARSPG